MHSAVVGDVDNGTGELTRVECSSRVGAERLPVGDPVVAEDEAVEGVDHRSGVDEQRDLVVGEVFSEQVVLVVGQVPLGDRAIAAAMVRRLSRSP